MKKEKIGKTGNLELGRILKLFGILLAGVCIAVAGTAAGKDAQAVGLKITPKDAKAFTIIVNYEPEGTEVVLGELKTKDRFIMDYKE